MQTFQLLIKSNNLPEPKIDSGDLLLSNNYYTHRTIIGGEITNSINIMEFLNDTNNEKIASSFSLYLKSTITDKSKLDSILYDNNKLSEIFNDYYNKKIRLSQTPNIKLITQNLSGRTTGNTNYFIPIIISKYFAFSENTTSDKFDENCTVIEKIAVSDVEIIRDGVTFKKISRTTINTRNIDVSTNYIQCFVDLNKNDNENETWKDNLTAIIL